ncbi:hypothetical protein EDD85DRAFT_958544 [Armillaria nabsnona]|nr:hypothetical protein EDD85DRAFT_958544 [Armillaria nabsnona]
MTSDNTVNIIYIVTIGAWGLGVLLYCLTAYFRTLPVAVHHYHHHHHHHHRRNDESSRPVQEPIPLRRAGTPAIPHLAELPSESEPEEIFMANTRTREEGKEREVAIALGAATSTTLLLSRSASYHPHSPTPSKIVRHYNLQTSPTYRTMTMTPPSGNHHWTAPPTIRIDSTSSNITALRWEDPVPSPAPTISGPLGGPPKRGTLPLQWTRGQASSRLDHESTDNSTPEPSEQPHPLTLHANRHIEFADTASAADVASFYSAQPEATPWYTTSSGRAIPDDRSQATRELSVERQKRDQLSLAIDQYMGGRVTHIAVILWEASFLDLFKHFVRELPLTATWLLGAGRTYTYHIANGLDTQEQLSDEAGRFTVNLWNQLHPDDPREIEAKAQEPHPMPIEPPCRRNVQYAPPPGPPPRTRQKEQAPSAPSDEAAPRSPCLAGSFEGIALVKPPLGTENTARTPKSKSPRRRETSEKHPDKDDKKAAGQEAASAQAVERGHTVSMIEVPDEEDNTSFQRWKKAHVIPSVEKEVISPTVVGPSPVNTKATEVPPEWLKPFGPEWTLKGI